MPCVAPARGKTDLKLPLRPGWQHDPCGLPIVTTIGLTDVSAQNLCLWHYGLKQGQGAIGRWVVQAGDPVGAGWGTPEASGTLGFTDPLYSMLGITGVPAQNGEVVLVRVGTVVIGQYLVGSPLSLASGQIGFSGSIVYIHKVNRNGVDQTAALAALVGTATTVDWHVI